MDVDHFPDPQETMLRVEHLDLRMDELRSEADALNRLVQEDPTLALTALGRMNAINAEMDLLIRSARDIRREQIEGRLRDRAVERARRPSWKFWRRG